LILVDLRSSVDPFGGAKLPLQRYVESAASLGKLETLSLSKCRVNPEQTQAFMLESRRVDTALFFLYLLLGENGS
jgi:hypothetical protein